MDGSLKAPSYYDDINVRGAAANTADPSSVIKYFEEMCPYLMAIGMTYDEYWYGDNFLPQYYFKAYKIRLKNRDEELHRQGRYIYEGMAALYPLFNALSKKKKPAPYVEKPYLSDILKTEQELEDERLREQAKAFDMLIAEINKDFKRKEVKDSG